MSAEARNKAKKILDNYLEMRNHRKTPERYAILDAVYNLDGHFLLDDLDRQLEKQSFRVSRATLYNTMRLFMRVGIVVRHRLQDKTMYEAGHENDSHCHQYCTVCGKMTEVFLPRVSEAVGEAKFRRFHKDGFSLYIYGICGTCQTRLKRGKGKSRSGINEK